MTYQTILTESLGEHICRITFNRPEAANALNQQMAEELVKAVRKAQSMPALRVIILTGAGNRAFCAGADLKERKGMDRQAWQKQHAAFEKALTTLLHCPQPVIAAVNGAAIGGGLELALACDFIYAAHTARFGLTEATLGIMPGMGGTQTLPRAIGLRKAKELLFRGTLISAEEALAMGLINCNIAPESLIAASIATAQSIAANAPLAITAIKRAVNEGIEQPLAQALHTELEYYNALLTSHDRHEGINAFNEKRPPHFTGT